MHTGCHHDLPQKLKVRVVSERLTAKNKNPQQSERNYLHATLKPLFSTVYKSKDAFIKERLCSDVQAEASLSHLCSGTAGGQDAFVQTAKRHPL